MKFRILSGTIVIGETNFDGLDPSMGFAHGVFFPSPSYQEVQFVFRLYAEAGTSMADADGAKLAEYYRARDALNLSVVTAEGKLVPTEFVHIIDYSKELGEMAVEVIVTDLAAFHRYFEAGA